MAKAAQSHGPYKKSKLIPVFLCALLPGCSRRGVHGGWGEDDKLRMLAMERRTKERTAPCCSATLGLGSSSQPYP